VQTAEAKVKLPLAATVLLPDDILERTKLVLISGPLYGSTEPPVYIYI
jgi:hypothetical protein